MMKIMSNDKIMSNNTKQFQMILNDVKLIKIMSNLTIRALQLFPIQGTKWPSRGSRRPEP